jgi:predicted Rossmann-fold nucleotide-binding protein
VIAFPGGFGTLDELFEILTLVQTGKISREDVVILLYGETYWRKILNFEELIKAGTISPEDAKLFSYMSEPAPAFAFLKKKLLKFCRTVGPAKIV